MDEAEILSGLRAGAAEAHEALYDTYASELYDYCYALLQDTDAAAAALRETLQKVAASNGARPGGCSLRAWLYALARSACRAGGNRMIEHPVPEDDPSALLLITVLGTLTARDREILELTGHHGLGVADLEPVLGLPREKVASLTGEARGRFDQAMAEELDRTGPVEYPSLATIMEGGDALGLLFEAIPRAVPPPGERARALTALAGTTPAPTASTGAAGAGVAGAGAVGTGAANAGAAGAAGGEGADADGAAEASGDARTPAGAGGTASTGAASAAAAGADGAAEKPAGAGVDSKASTGAFSASAAADAAGEAGAAPAASSGAGAMGSAGAFSAGAAAAAAGAEPGEGDAADGQAAGGACAAGAAQAADAGASAVSGAGASAGGVAAGPAVGASADGQAAMGAGAGAGSEFLDGDAEAAADDGHPTDEIPVVAAVPPPRRGKRGLLVGAVGAVVLVAGLVFGIAQLGGSDRETERPAAAPTSLAPTSEGPTNPPSPDSREHLIKRKAQPTEAAGPTRSGKAGKRHRSRTGSHKATSSSKPTSRPTYNPPTPPSWPPYTPPPGDHGHGPGHHRPRPTPTSTQTGPGNSGYAQSPDASSSG